MVLSFSRRASLLACASLAVAVATSSVGTPAAQPLALGDVLANYARAVADAGAPAVVRYETSGTLAGAGLTGAFHTWVDGDDERDDQNLGLRSETTLRLGERIYVRNADGNVRRLTGILLRHERTAHLIDTGDFATMPDRCRLRGAVRLGSRAAYALEIAAVDGDTETLFLDATTWLPLEVAYDEDDGRTTLDFSDWRTVSGHRFPYVTVVSDGSHAFDTTETTTQLSVGAPVEAAVFALPVSRTIEMSGTETVHLSDVQQHLYVPVTIAGHTYTFLLDSGAESVVLDRRVAREAGLTPQGALEASGASRIGGAQIALLPELAVGTGRLRDLVVTVLDLGATTSGQFRIDGILGYPFFAATVARIDPGALTLTFGAPGALVPRGERVPLEVDRALPEAHLRLDRQIDANFVIDTGNSAELLIYRPFADKHAGLSPYSSDSRRSFGIGGSMSSYATSIDELDFGSIPLYHAYAEVMLSTSGAFADRFDAGNVGLGLLRNFAFTFDPNDGALYLEKAPDFNDGSRRL